MIARLLLVLPATLLVAVTTYACSDGGEEAVAVEEIDCSAIAALDSYHLSTRTVFAVTDTGSEATPGPEDLPPFNVSWSSELDFTDGGENAQGAVVTNDSGREEAKNVIVVGPNQWIALPDRPNAYLEGGSGSSVPFPPQETCIGLADDIDPATMTGEPEDVDGVAGMKYEINDLPSEALADMPSIGGGADAVNVIKEYDGTLWVANAGYMSRLELKGNGEYEGGRRAMDVEFFFEYSDVDDVDVEIVAPQPLAGQ